MKKFVLVSFLLMCVLLAPTVYAYREVWDIYHDKDVMIQMWKDLCNSHSSTCSYEIIGKSYLGQNIYLFKVGTPTGGKVLIDGSMHGWEDSGTEFGYVFAKYILEGSDSEAKRIQKNNYILFIPIVNMDTASRQTVKRVLDNGTEICCGVDVNRNFCTGFGSMGSTDTTQGWPVTYMGPYCASEGETKAVRTAMQKYRPEVYLNVHMGGNKVYGACDANSVIGKKIIAEYDAIRKANNITYRYPIGGACGGGTAPADGRAFGANAWYTETVEVAYVPNTATDLINEYWPLNYPMWVAMAHAVEIIPTAVTTTTTATNTAPTHNNPSLRASDHPTNSTQATIICHNISTYDAEGDKIAYYYKWYKNNIQVTGQYGYSIAPTYTAPGQVWKCEMRPYDGKIYGTAKNSSTITIRATTTTNTAPTQGNPNLKISDFPKNSTEGTLTCHNTSTYDADGDTVTYHYKWFKNNVQVSGQYGYSITPSYTAPGEVWKCEMRPYDGKLYGTAKNSSTITITATNTAPGLRGSWDLATNYIDTVRGNNALAYGNTLFVKDYTYGSVLRFDNSKSYLKIAYANSSLTPQDGFTVDVKVKFNSVRHSHIVRDSESYLLQRVYINATTSRFQAGVYRSNAWYPILTSSTNLQTNKWYRVTYTYDKSSGMFKLYLDKRLNTQKIWSGTVDTSSSSQIFVGNREQLDRWLDGSIHDLRIYNRALSDTEVKNLP